MDGYYAFMIVATLLVLMMTTPALALFYGGMTRSKSVLNMMMMSYIAMGVVGIVYVLWGWSESFSDGFSGDGKLFASPFEQFGLKGISTDNYIDVMFQLTFAVITAALISGAIADRVKLSVVGGVPPAVGDAVATSRWPTWCSAAASSAARSAPRTTPAVRRSTSTPVSPAWCWRC